MSKKKAPPIEAKEGTILIFPEAISDEEFQRIKKVLADCSCDFSFLIKNPCDVVSFSETYWGPCPWCREEVYTKDVCPECGKLIDIS